MTTDKELLEAAARAAGLKWHRHTEGGLWLKGDGDIWNALVSNNDAMCLSVALGICIEPYPLYSMPKHSVITKQRRRSDQLREANPTECVEVYGTDPEAATRRAIVRAAAALDPLKQGEKE